MPEQTQRWRLSRRGFLIGLGATGAALTLGVTVGLPYARLQIAGFLAEGSGPPGGIDAPPTTWFEITPDNRIRLFIPKIEMGQGVHTSLAQIGAEELGITWEQLDVVQASTNSGLVDSTGTSASNSVSSLFMPLREAAATLREMLRAEAARQLGVPAAALVAVEGMMRVADAPGQALTYGEIVAAKSGEWETPETAPPLKPRSEFQFIGQPLPRVDFAAKLTGQATYGYDARLPGMLYGAVVHPPTLSATLKSAASGAAAEQPGVVQIVAEKDFAGVAAETRRAASLGAAALDVSWEDGEAWQQETLEAMVTVGEGKPVVIQKEGDAAANLAQGTPILAEYRTPFAAHAHLEPQAALVDVQPDKVTAWVSTQSAYLVRSEIADALGRDEETVEVIPTYLGGGFGRRLNVKVAIEAARLSAAAGRPVHVGWSRQDEFQHGYLRPPTHHVLKAVVDANGRMQAMEHQQASGDVALPFLPGIAGAVLGADFGATRGAHIIYAVPHRRTVALRAKLPVPTGWWRGLGLLP
ncbi:MAG: xanthine dehydrogenase family protein molybdopterin-binding subunit, partial [Anaerolineales bacterium]|nr:xanthine dehydrogenase family protein molybdopterin-binding subunit [Anaerolineales bacterium]